MTDADKLIIDNLVSTMKNVKDGIKDRKYFNEYISNYAKAAFKNYTEIRDYIIDIIKNNIEYVFNLDDVRVDNRGRNYWFIHKYDYSYLRIYFTISNYDNKKVFSRGNGTYGIKLTKHQIDIQYVDIDMGSNVNSRIYNIICNHREFINKYWNYWDKHNDDTYWKSLFTYANNTKEYIKELLNQFKKFIRERTDEFHKESNKKEQLHNEVCNMGHVCYENVTMN